MQEGGAVSKNTHYPESILIRMAPLQLQVMDFMMKKFPEEFPTRTDYIRKAITLQAKHKLSEFEFGVVCSNAFKEQPAETRYRQ
jgi:hypothetical protein